MVYLGAADAVEAKGDERLVCDIYSATYVAWVDNRRGNLGLDVVDRAAAAAAADGRRPLVFVPGGIRPAAQQRADELGVALLRFGPYDGGLEGANALGRQLRATGMEPR
jgi:predicted RecB family endonuclease